MSATNEMRDDYAHARVPDAARGSAWRVFFIVAGSMGGLPTFILAVSLFSGLGVQRGLLATLLGAAVSGILGGLSAASGSRSGMGLAVLSEAVFGRWGGRVVKLVIAVALIGWFAVEIAVLGAALAEAMRQILGVVLRPEAVSIPFAIAIAVITSFRVKGLERIGQVLVPLLALCLLLTVLRSGMRPHATWTIPGNCTIGFGAAVSAVIGSYIVGIVIQPDYSRFVRRPVRAGFATFSALGLVFPAVVVLSALPSLALHQQTLIGTMILLGLGMPALVLLTLGAAIDTSACLYSGSLPLASELRQVRLGTVIAVAAAASIGLALLHVETHFIGFLVTLGVALPPLAAVLIWCTLRPGAAARDPARNAAVHAMPMAAWLGGAVLGEFAATRQVVLTGLPAVDSVLASLLVLMLADFLHPGRRKAHRPVP